MNEENSVGIDGAAKINIGVELREAHYDVVERHVESLVDDDAKTSFIVVVDD
jgi:hypothetical protein